MSRVFGLGGKDYYPQDAENFFAMAIETMEKGYAETIRLLRYRSRKS